MANYSLREGAGGELCDPLCEIRGSPLFAAKGRKIEGQPSPKDVFGSFPK